MHYRPLQMSRLDGKDIKPSERIAAQQAFPSLHSRLCDELRAEGIDPEQAAIFDNQEEDYDEEIEETGYLNPEVRSHSHPIRSQ